MKQHHLSFSGIEQSIVIESHKLAEGIARNLPSPPVTKSLVFAVADILAVLGGDALEAKAMTDDEIRALVADMREVINRRKARPKISELQRQVLNALGRASDGLTISQLCAQLSLPRTTITTALHACMNPNRDLVRRELRETKGYYKLTDRAAEFRS